MSTCEARRGVYVVIDVLLNHHCAVRTMDVAVMSMRIDRIGYRAVHDDANMKTPAWLMLVDMRPMMVYMVLILLGVWPVLMTVVRMPVLVMPPSVLLPLATMLVVSRCWCCYT